MEKQGWDKGGTSKRPFLTKIQHPLTVILT